MSTQTTVMGYIGERSAKLSSVYADNFVVPDLIDTTSTPADTETITMNTTSGRFTTDTLGPTTEGSVVMTVSNSTVGVGSKILITIHSSLTENATILAYVQNIVQGAFDIRVANLGTGTPSETMVISFLVFNPSG